MSKSRERQVARGQVGRASDEGRCRASSERVAIARESTVRSCGFSGRHISFLYAAIKILYYEGHEGERS